jgi:MftR C-terminal domain
VIVERTGRAPDDIEVRCAAAAIIAVSAAVIRHRVDRGGAEDLVALYDRPFRTLAEGLRC